MSEVPHNVRVATHEAGHAVCARLLRLPGCGGVFLEPEPGAFFPRDHGAASVCAMMAGAIAEVIHFGDYDPIGITTDWRRARRRMKRLGYHDNGEALWNYTYGLLRGHRGTIALVALRLLAAGALTADEIDGLMRSP